MVYSALHIGSRNSISYRCYLQCSGRIISPLHDVPLYHTKDEGTLNMIVEIPRFSNAKYEISNGEPFNPIIHDNKNGQLKYCANVFPYHGFLWNYGALPQTWEAPSERDSITGLGGDGDPIDVLEIGSRIAKTGEVRQVKVLGALALVDGHELDWKIFTIDIQDPLASQINTAEDLEVICPGMITASKAWYLNFPGKSFAYDGRVLDREFAMDLILKTHEHWRTLSKRAQDSHGIWVNSSNDNLQLEGHSLTSDMPDPTKMHDWTFVKPGHTI